jgi:hypothetical protein
VCHIRVFPREIQICHENLTIKCHLGKINMGFCIATCFGLVLSLFLADIHCARTVMSVNHTAIMSELGILHNVSSKVCRRRSL